MEKPLSGRRGKGQKSRNFVLAAFVNNRFGCKKLNEFLVLYFYNFNALWVNKVDDALFYLKFCLYKN